MVHTPILPAVRKLKQEKSKFEARRGYKNEILSKQKKKKIIRDGHWLSLILEWTLCSGYSLCPWPWAIWPNRGGASYMLYNFLSGRRMDNCSLLGGKDQVRWCEAACVSVPTFPRTLKMDLPEPAFVSVVPGFYTLLNTWYPLNRSMWTFLIIPCLEILYSLCIRHKLGGA